MSLRLVPKLVTLNDLEVQGLNGVMAVTLGYFAEYGRLVFHHITASTCGRIYARADYISWSLACTM